MELDWDTTERLNALSPQEKTDVLNHLLAFGKLHPDVTKELQVILSNIIIKQYLDDKYPLPVKEKKPKAPRKKKVIADVPVVVDDSVV